MNKLEKDLSKRIEHLRELVHRLYDLTGNPWEDDQHPVTEQDNTQEENYSGIRSFSVATPTPKNKEHTKDRSGKPKPWWKSGLVKIQSSLTLANFGILAVIAYAATTFWQWRDLRHNFQADQRAWIKIGYIWPDNINSIPITAHLTFHNVGKSVVTIIYAESSFEVVDYDKEPSFSLDRKRHNTTSQGVMFPTDTGSPSSVDLFDHTTKATRGFTKEEIQSLIYGKSYVAVYGFLVYGDQFGAHWYRFCNFRGYSAIDTTANAEECVAWNQVGDGWPSIPYSK